MNEKRETVFDRILRGEIPAFKVYEDEHVVAFLDAGPLSRGHTLVIPKERCVQLHELSDEAAAAIGRVLPRLCRALRETTGMTDYNILQNNGQGAHQAVMYVHFHIIPKGRDDGLEIGWPARQLDREDAQRLQERIRQALA